MAAKRPKGKREADLATLSDLYFQCVPITEIAKRIGVSRQTINGDLKELDGHWKAARIGKVDAVKARLEAELLWMRREVLKDFQDDAISAKEKDDLLLSIWDRFCRLYGVHETQDGPPPRVTVEFITRRKECATPISRIPRTTLQN